MLELFEEMLEVTTVSEDVLEINEVLEEYHYD